MHDKARATLTLAEVEYDFKLIDEARLHLQRVPRLINKLKERGDRLKVREPIRLRDRLEQDLKRLGFRPRQQPLSGKRSQPIREHRDTLGLNLYHQPAGTITRGWKLAGIAPPSKSAVAARAALVCFKHEPSDRSHALSVQPLDRCKTAEKQADTPTPQAVSEEQDETGSRRRQPVSMPTDRNRI